MWENNPLHCCNYFPCAQTFVQSGVIMQEKYLIHLPVWPDSSNSFFNFFNVCTNCSELIVAPLSKNSTNKIPSLSQESLLWQVSHCGHCPSVLFITLKTMGTASNSANLYGVLTIHASQTSINLYHSATFLRKEFDLQSLPSSYIHHTCHLALLLC